MKIAHYFKQLLVGVSASVLLFSCEKAKEVQLLDGDAQRYIKFVDYGGWGKNFGNSALALDATASSEFIEIQVELVGDKVSKTDTKVRVEVDPAAVAAFNATKTDPLDKYELLPPSGYTFAPVTFTIPAGESMSDILEIEFHPDMIDGSINTMLPLSIKTITGAPEGTIPGPNTGTAFFHFIGNPLAGNYSVVGTRYNATPVGDQNWNGVDPIPPTFTTAAIPSPKFLAPITPKISMTYIANLGAGTDRDYYFDVDATITTEHEIDVTFTPSFTAGISNVRWFKKTYNPTTKKITLLWSYNNLAGGAGNDRIISEVLTKL